MSLARHQAAAAPFRRRIVTGFSPARVAAMCLRYAYLLAASWPRLLDIAYWPTVQMVSWGFLTVFLAPQTGFLAQGFGVLLAAALLWDVLFRGQIGVAVSFFEEMYARNLGHLMVSPLKPTEFMVSLLVMSFVRTLIGLVPASLLAIWFFGYSIYSMGLALVGFFFGLIVMGWAIGLFVAGLVMRNGLGAESLAWALIFALAPLSGVYYPILVLPWWLQPVAYALPSSHVFEGMRAVVLHHEIAWHHLAWAGALDVVYLALGMLAFLGFYRAAKDRGKILQVGE
jgi:ABC-2 type transport system permease protein